MTVKIEREGASLQFMYPFQNTSIRNENNTLIYSSSNLPVEAHYSVVPNGIKEELVLNKIPQQNTFTTHIKAEGLIPKINSTNIVAFYTSKGKYQFHFERPFVKDANGSVSYDVKYHLKKISGEKITNGILKTDEKVAVSLYSSTVQVNSPTLNPTEDAYILEIEVDPIWLHDQKRKLPITIDPTVVHDTSSEFASGDFDGTRDVGTGSTFTSATGGTITTSGDYTIHTFTGNGTFTPNGAGNVEVLVVGGGGGGGSDGGRGGGGGGGGVIFNPAYSVTAQAYSVQVGNGGNGGIYGVSNSTSGGNSQFDTLIAYGGGRGGGRANLGFTDAGGNGGSGGGGDAYYVGAGGTGTAGQGYGGGTGTNGTYGAGGGGGAGGVGGNGSGHDGGSGGPGLSFTISGSSVTYGCGGGGGYTGTGGVAGCSNAGAGTSVTGGAGVANTGGGGGGGSNGGNGGSGIIIIRYRTQSISSYFQELTNDQHTVGLWHLNESSGNAIDSSGNGFTGTATGTSVVNGLLGNARYFNSTTDKITIADSPLLSPRERTIEAWVKFNALGTDKLFLGKGAEEWFVYNGTTWGCTANKISFMMYNSTPAWTCISSSITPETGRWYHIAGVYDGTTMQLYIDGKLEAGPTALTLIGDQTSSFDIGAHQGLTNTLPVEIDEVRFSNIARTPNEIYASATRKSTATYTSDIIDLTDVDTWNTLTWTEGGVQTSDGETLKDSTGLIAHWKFNESSGTTAVNSTGTCGAPCNGALTSFTNTSGRDAVTNSGWSQLNRRWGEGAIMFDEIDDVVSVTDNNSLSFGSGGTDSPFSIETWVKPNSLAGTSDGNWILSKRDAATNEEYQLIFWQGSIGFNLFSTNANYIGRYTSDTFKPGYWYYIVATYDCSKSVNGIKIYVNGKLSSTITSNSGTYTGMSNGNSNVLFGKASWSTALNFNGTIDTTRIYSRVLGLNEIVSNYNTASLEIQTRVGNSANPDDGSWEAWKPTTSESQLDPLETDELTTRVYKFTVADHFTNQTWIKRNNVIPNASDTTSTDGRIPLGTAGKSDQSHVYAPTVIYDSGIYKMWFNTHDGTNIRIGYATSTDGLTWTKYDNTIPTASDSTSTNGRVPLGNAGKGDTVNAAYANVIKDGTTYKMWYSGSDGTNWRIFYATSPDGLTWTKYDNTIPTNSNTTGTNGRIPLGVATSGDDGGALRATVIKDGSMYKMWYSGANGGTWRIYYATSPDGLTWAKYDNTIPTASDSTSTNGRVPLGTAGTADANHAYEPTVIKDGTMYKMWYNAHRGTVQIAYATSFDGLTWTKYDNTIEQATNLIGTRGRLPNGSLGDLTHSYGPSVIKAGNSYKMWYSGLNTNWRIYHATLTPLPASQSTDNIIKTEGSASTKITTHSVVDAGTIGLWRLDETNGTGAYLKDSGPYGFHATPNNATLARGISSRARSVNAGSAGTQTDYIDTGINNSPTKFSDAFSVEAWIKPTVLDASHNTIVGQETGVLFAFNSAGQVANYIYAGGAWSAADGSACTVSLNKWQHMALTYDGAYVKSYLNGQQCGGGTAKTGTMSSTSNIFIGMRAPGGTKQPMHGLIDEVHISKTTRTPEEIAESYKLGKNQNVNYPINPVNLQNKYTIPFMIAADKPGTYLTTTIGETLYANGQPDKNTVGFWHMDDTKVLPWTDTFPGTTITKWVEIDPNANKIAQNSGLQLSAGAAAAWDSGVISRQVFSNKAGNQLYARFTTSSSVAAPNHMMIGWGQNQIASANYNTISHAFYFNAGTIYVYQDGALFGGSYGAYSANTTYEILLTINPVGNCSYHIRGGAYSNWTLLLAADNAKGNTSFRAQVANYQHVGTFSNISVFTPSITDATGYGNNGNIIGPYINGDYKLNRPGVHGDALEFNGTSYSVEVPAGPGTSLDIDSGVVTIEAWVKPNDIASATQIIAARGQYSAYGYGLRQNANVFNLGSHGGGNFNGLTTLTAGKWYHVAGVVAGTNSKLYVNGVLDQTGTVSIIASDQNFHIGSSFDGTNPSNFYNGVIDEVRVSNIERSPEEIRQTYERGIRSRNITIDFGAKLDSGNLIADSNDLTFTIDATVHGIHQKGDKVYSGDKIIVRENYNGTPYIAQGIVTSVVPSTGAITIASWDSGSTYPPGGFTAEADVFKWQKEYWNISQPFNSIMESSSLLTLQITNGGEGRTIWLDDLRAGDEYLTNPLGSTILSSTGNRYFQYRTIFHSADEAVSANVSAISMQYTVNTAPNTPTLNSPANAATGVSRTPTFYTTATDANSDHLQYKITLCTDSNMTQNCQTFDQTQTQSGWVSQNADSGTAYNSGTQGIYTLTTPLNYLTTYYWKSTTIDPDGINTWSGTQTTPFSFTTTHIEPATNCKLTRVGSTNVIEWTDNATTEAGYAIQRNVNNSGWTNLNMSLNASAVSYIDSPVVNNTTYQYRVAPYIAGPQYTNWCETATQNISVGTLRFEGNFNFSGIEVQ